jgi:hypothetical protein
MNASIANIINIPKKKNIELCNNPMDTMLPCSNSTNAISIITPAEKPILKEMNLGLGFLIIRAITLPIVVDNPASKLKKSANRITSITKFTNLGISK